jgi:predicted RecA/RadA family phage recombinase
MATNIVYEDGDQLEVAPTAPTATTITSGQACLVGELPGVALTDADDTVGNGGTCTVKFNGVARLSVKGADGSGNAAIAAGDIVYLDGSEVNADVTNGVRFGYALEPVVSGATTTIKVKIGY